MVFTHRTQSFPYSLCFWSMSAGSVYRHHNVTRYVTIIVIASLGVINCRNYALSGIIMFVYPQFEGKLIIIQSII